MRNKLLLLLIVIVSFVSYANANVYDYPTKVSALVNELPPLETITCKFKQEKQLRNVSKPIISSGDFKFVKNQGIYFDTKYPVKSSVSYTNKDYKQINDIIQAISNKKYSKIEKEFNFYYQRNNGNWLLGLKPKEHSNTISYINTITIEGNKNIDKIIIDLKNGNLTTLWFMTK